MRLQCIMKKLNQKLAIFYIIYLEFFKNLMLKYTGIIK